MATIEQQAILSEGLKVSRKRVLIVDDEAGIRLALSHLIEDTRPHYEVATAESAEEAMRLIKEAPFDVMLTDYRLPEMDGLTLAQCANESSPKTWSILMTAYGSEQTHSQAFSEGCIAYVQKPFEVDQLLDWIDHAMNRPEPTATHRSLAYGLGHDGNMLNAFSMAAEINEKPWYTPIPRKDRKKHPSAVQVLCRSMMNILK